MICSACGFDNPGEMRFCGMCGVPLPQRPITAPGAQSTLRFTRIPVDTHSPLSERNANTVSGNASSVANTAASGVLENPPSRPPEPIRAADQAGHASVQPDIAVPAEPQPKELVPDVPLHEYVQKFHYEPPKDPAEVTMRGEAHDAASGHSTGPTTTNEPIVGAVSGSSIVSGTSADLSPASAAADQDSRLGLEPEAAAETHIPRPRFLDINEPPKETEIRSSGSSTIAGPSFLGLNETPQNWAEAVGVEPGNYAPRSHHWRAWIAAVVVLVIASLALLEWRAQRNETNDGPVEIIRTKMHNLRHAASQQDGTENPASAATAPAGADSNAKPEMQVEQQPKPQTQSKDASPSSNDQMNAGQGATAQPSATNSAGSAENQTPGGQSATASMPAAPQAAQTEQGGAAPATATPRQKPTAIADNSQSTQQTQAALKTKRQQVDKSDDSDAAGKQAIPGGDEMSKAKNASDSAAAAAWLWKATAKGNPDAPVQLADMYINGDGVPRSCEQALVLLKTAAEKENARARNRLAAMYSTGICVQRNRVEAYRWLSSALAANPNSQWAQQNRDLLWQQMNPEERAAAEKYR